MVPVPEKKYSCSTYPSGTGGSTEKPSAMNGKSVSVDAIGPVTVGIDTVNGVTSLAAPVRGVPTSPTHSAAATRGSHRPRGGLHVPPPRITAHAPPSFDRGRREPTRDDQPRAIRPSDVTCTASAAFVVRCVTSSIGVQRVNVLPRPEIPTVLVPGGQGPTRPRGERPSTPGTDGPAHGEARVGQEHAGRPGPHRGLEVVGRRRVNRRDLLEGRRDPSRDVDPCPLRHRPQPTRSA